MKKSLLALLLAVAVAVPAFAAKGDTSVNAKLGLGLNNSVSYYGAFGSPKDIAMDLKLNMPVSLGVEFFYGVFDKLSVGFGVNYVLDAEGKSEDPYYGSKVKAGTTNIYLAVKPEVKIDSKIFSSMYAIGQVGLTMARANVKNDYFHVDESPSVDSGLYLGLGMGTIIKDVIIVELICSSANGKIDGDLFGSSSKIDVQYTATTLNIGYKFAL